MDRKPFVHPYIPNSVPEVKRAAPPHRSVVNTIDEAPFDDPARWAVTWRAYVQKRGRPVRP